MPIYDYRCEDCQELYEVYHKVREDSDDVVCPRCASHRHKKLMSVPAAPSVSGGSAESYGACDNAGGCGCSGGACGMN
jgi:putative FmdB family regulatory protein